MILMIASICASLICLTSAIVGGDLLRSRYLVHKKIYPAAFRCFWLLIASMVFTLILSAIVMQNWWSLLVTFVIGYAVLSRSLSAKTEVNT
jgi:hypothetical protein